MIYRAETVFRAAAAHGEGAWWDDRRGELLFLDCAGHRLFTYDPGTGRSLEHPLPFNPQAVCGLERGGYIACSEKTVWRLDDAFRVAEKLADTDNGAPESRFNDCKCGPDGAFWMGTLTSAGAFGLPDGGRLYRYAPDGGFSVVLDGVGLSNGFVWTRDRKTVYYTDTVGGVIYAFDYDGPAHALRNRRVVFRDPAVYPDGMTIDTDDRIWAALWGAGKVVCIDPATGETVHEVLVPGADLTSSACFGGADFSTLFITTSRLGLTEADLAAKPDSGSLFAVRVDARGSQFFRGAF